MSDHQSYMQEKYESFECGCVRVRKCTAHDVVAIVARLAELEQREREMYDEECSAEVHAARMAKQGYSYDATDGIWWKDDDKPGVLRELDSRITELTQRLDNVTSTLTRAQEEGTRLVLENRQLRDELAKFVKIGPAKYVKSTDTVEGFNDDVNS